MLTFIDGDSILFKAACTAGGKGDVRKSIKEQIDRIEGECWMNPIQIAVKGRGNFRYDCYKDYKSNRKPIDEKIRKLINYGHEHVVEKYTAHMADGMEADDLVSIWCWNSLKTETPYVVAHIDKDLNQIPGAHYNYNKGEHYDVSPEEGYRYLMNQWVMGDSTDGIPGVPGVGPKKAEAYLKGIPLERLERRVRALYRAKKLSKDYCQAMYDCVYMLQSMEEFDEHQSRIQSKANLS